MSDDQQERLSTLEQRVDRLEHLLLATQTRSVVQPPPPPFPLVGSGSPAQGLATTTAQKSHAKPGSIGTETVLKWGGIVLVVLAVAFAVSTAISRGWIGPELQLLGAVSLSVALIATGLRVQRSRPRWMHTLCSGGVVALFVTGSSNLFVDLAGRGAGLAFVAAATLIGFALAHQARSQWVALATVTSSLIAALVLEVFDAPTVGFLGWGLAVSAVAIATALHRRWYSVAVIAHLFAMVWTLGAAVDASTTADGVVILIGVGIVISALHVLPSLREVNSVWQEVHMRIAGLAGPWAVAAIAVAFEMSRDSAGATALGLSIGGFVLAFPAEERLRPPHFVALLVGASVTLSIALALLLDTNPTGLAFAAQGVGLVILARYVKSFRWVFANAVIVLGIAATIGSAAMVNAWIDDASTTNDVIHAGIVVLIAVAAALMKHTVTRAIAALVAISLLLLLLGSTLVHLPQGQAIVSVTWAVIGVSVLVTGAISKESKVGIVGMVILAITVAKLLTVDLTAVDTLWRAGLFLVVGLGLLRLAFLLPRLMGDTDASPSLPISADRADHAT